MPGRIRPIEKFGQAVAKCSPEVNEEYNLNPKAYLLTFFDLAFRLWQMYCSGLQQCTQRQVPHGVSTIEGLLPGKSISSFQKFEHWLT